MYKVMHPFTDTQDHNRVYHVGDKYPAQGYQPDEGRAEHLILLGYILEIAQPVKRRTTKKEDD